jgi:hypothetical protein
MRHYLQLAFATLLTATMAHAQFHMPQLSHKEKENREELSWLAPFAEPAPSGQAAMLVHDPRFKPFLRDHLTARQAFWNENQSLAETILEFLGTPNAVLLDNNRYLVVDGCVAAFCPARGLLFVDLGTPHPLVVFAALDWVKENKATDQPGAEYTLWVFANHSFRPEGTPAANPQDSNAPNALNAKETLSIPVALTRAIARWSAQPVPGSNTRQNITRAVIVEPDSAGHQVPPAAIGAASIPQPSEAKVKP